MSVIALVNEAKSPRRSSGSATIGLPIQKGAWSCGLELRVTKIYEDFPCNVLVN